MLRKCSNCNDEKSGLILDFGSTQIKHIDKCDLSIIDCIVLFASHILNEVEYDLKSKGYSGELLVLEL